MIFSLNVVEIANASDSRNQLNSFFVDNFEFENPFTPCEGNCGAYLFSGQSLDTGMAKVFGISGFTPPWKYDFRESGIVGAAFSRRLATGFNSLSFEGEVGVAQRFGSGADATEIWGAFYARWSDFPWNHIVYTTVAVSTGLSYASTIDEVEAAESITHSKLLHYLSPEITFADPARKDRSLVLRLHHRSGGRMFGMTSGIFNGVSGGAQFITLGIRQNF